MPLKYLYATSLYLIKEKKLKKKIVQHKKYKKSSNM